MEGVEAAPARRPRPGGVAARAAAAEARRRRRRRRRPQRTWRRPLGSLCRARLGASRAPSPTSTRAGEVEEGARRSRRTSKVVGIVVDGAEAPREDPRVSMVAGSCAHPECHVRRAVADALRQKQDFSRLDDGAAVTVTCTNANCTAGGRMHATCFAKLETQLLKTLRQVQQQERCRALEDDVDVEVRPDPEILPLQLRQRVVPGGPRGRLAEVGRGPPRANRGEAARGGGEAGGAGGAAAGGAGEGARAAEGGEGAARAARRRRGPPDRRRRRRLRVQAPDDAADDRRRLWRHQRRRGGVAVAAGVARV